MKTVVTGATGRVGANLIKRLIEKSYDVTGCLLPNDSQETKLNGLKVEKAYVNILDTDGMAKTIKNSDVVIHTAAVHEGSLSEIQYSDFFDINVKGMFNVLEGIRESGKNTHLICLSSTSVYDVFTAPRTPIKEDQERKPITLYGMNKILVEEQVRQYEWQYDIPATIIRPNYIVAGPEMLDVFNYSVVFDVLYKYAGISKTQLYVPDNPDAWMAAEESYKIKMDNPCIPRCPGDQSWHWHMTDVRDVVDFIELCLLNVKAHGKTFNLAAADICDWSKVVPYVAEKTGREIVEVEIPNLWQYSFDQSASHEILDFSSKYDHFAMVDIAVALHNNESVDVIPGVTGSLAY